MADVSPKIEPDPMKNERYQKNCADRRAYGFTVHEYEVWLSWDLMTPLPQVRELLAQARANPSELP